MTRILDVYLHKNLAGKLSQDADGKLEFTYQPDYISTSAPIVSVVMPPREEPYPDNIANPFFSGLLPDAGARKRLAKILQTSNDNTFGLLSLVGGECAGALTLLPEGVELQEENHSDFEILDDERLKQILGILQSRPLLAGEEGVRMSLAGAQDKLALLVKDDKLALAKGGQPTTHILKPQQRDNSGVVENEIFCMRLAQKIGLQAPHVQMGVANGQNFYLIERYDREINDGEIIRLHQEDFCQATGTPPHLKYEHEGGPSIKESHELIDKHSHFPSPDRLIFRSMIIFNYLIGNADAHGKNYSLLHYNEATRLAPLYDAICTAAYPSLPKELAMRIGGRDIPDTILAQHWAAEFVEKGRSDKALKAKIHIIAIDILNNIDGLTKELEDDGISHPILSDIRETIKVRTDHVLQFV